MDLSLKQLICTGTANGSTSELSYKPQSERDYGTLSCRGTNTVGRQLEPCVFQIVPAGKLFWSFALNLHDSDRPNNIVFVSSVTLWLRKVI